MAIISLILQKYIWLYSAIWGSFGSFLILESFITNAESLIAKQNKLITRYFFRYFIYIIILIPPLVLPLYFNFMFCLLWLFSEQIMFIILNIMSIGLKKYSHLKKRLRITNLVKT